MQTLTPVQLDQPAELSGFDGPQLRFCFSIFESVWQDCASFAGLSIALAVFAENTVISNQMHSSHRTHISLAAHPGIQICGIGGS
jgi:hypothetical protein